MNLMLGCEIFNQPFDHLELLLLKILYANILQSAIIIVINQFIMILI